MALERRRPLPAGRYWLDVPPLLKPKWDLWRNAMSKVDSVNVETTQHFEAVTGIPGIPNAPERDFVIFSLSSPNVAWEVAGLPSPAIAPPNVTSAADVADAPPPEPGVLEQLSSAAAGVGTTAKIGLGIGVAVVVVIGAFALARK